MAEEEIEETGTPSPASEEKKPEGEEPETINQEAELKKTLDDLAEKDKELAKLQDQLGKAGYTIQKLKDKMKEEGIELDERGELNEEKVREVIKEEIKKVTEGFSSQLSEIGRSLKARENLNKGSGPGQKQPKEDEGEKEPNLSSEDQKLVKNSNLKWDPKRKGYLGQSGRFYSWGDTTGIVAPER